jgi:hypothetical protein
MLVVRLFNMIHYYYCCVPTWWFTFQNDWDFHGQGHEIYKIAKKMDS